MSQPTFHNELQTLFGRRIFHITGPERARAAVLCDIDISMIGANLVSLFDNECGLRTAARGDSVVPSGNNSHSFIRPWNHLKFEQEIDLG